MGVVIPVTAPLASRGGHLSQPLRYPDGEEGEESLEAASNHQGPTSWRKGSITFW